MLQQPHGAAWLLPPSQPVGGVVRLPGRLRQSVLRAAGQDEIHGAPQIYAVPHRDVDRGDSVPRPEYPTDDLPTVHEVSGATLLPPWLLVAPHEPALGAPHRRNVEKESKVRGEAHPAGMRETLGVQYEGVHFCFYFPQRSSKRRHLPEREEPRYVRKPEWRLEALYLDGREPGELEHHDRGIGHVVLRGDVCPGHIPHAGEVEGRLRNDFGRQLVLQPPGLGRREIQRMEIFDLHPTLR